MFAPYVRPFCCCTDADASSCNKDRRARGQGIWVQDLKVGPQVSSLARVTLGALCCRLRKSETLCPSPASAWRVTGSWQASAGGHIFRAASGVWHLSPGWMLVMGMAYGLSAPGM